MDYFRRTLNLESLVNRRDKITSLRTGVDFSNHSLCSSVLLTQAKRQCILLSIFY